MNVVEALAWADRERAKYPNTETPAVVLAAEYRALRQALNEAVGLIKGLAEQQAMYDEWYKPELARIVAAAAGGEGTMKHGSRGEEYQ